MNQTSQMSYHEKLLKSLEAQYKLNLSAISDNQSRLTTPKLTEVNIIPIKPNQGLVGFASFVLNESLYLSHIGIYTKADGGYRLTYPTKKTCEKSLNIFYPINKEFGQHIENVILREFEKVMNKSNGRYNHA